MHLFLQISLKKNILCLADGHDICGGKVTNFIHKQTKWSSTVNTAENSMFGGSIAKFRHKKQSGNSRYTCILLVIKKRFSIRWECLMKIF